ncbi:MAG: ATP-binding cassette domain-containing protein [Spirochaetaceae bacterium]|nr:ATP-binding cassette domain-containing protein [Spirochaetaceae bacterium]
MNIVRLSSIRKYYRSSAAQALDGVDLELNSGEIHAVVGENGAGKSTLARILCGFERPDSGELYVKGAKVGFSSHRDAERAGIGFVPQYSMLAPGLTAAENVALGHEPRRLGPFTDRRRTSYEFSLLADRYGFAVDPDAVVASLSAAERREVEILRALARGGSALVLDEPTSILGEKETASLFALVRRLRDSGAGIVYISHRAGEIADLADRVTVLRSGAVERAFAAVDVDECELAGLIVSGASCADSDRTEGGRTAGRRAGAAPGEPALAIRGVSQRARGSGSLLRVDLTVRSGEIVSVIALGGNGLETLEDIAAGILSPDEGDVLVKGRPLPEWPRRELRSRVMAYLPTDRENRGLSPKASVAMNAVAGRLFDYSFAEFAAGARPLADAASMLGGFGVANWKGRRVDTLSGGNRQRVVASRELSGGAEIVVAANPAQGLDRGARSRLFSRLAAMRDSGSAVLLLSSDPDDAAELADRSFALYRGRLIPVERGDSFEDAFSKALTGARR